MPSPLDPRSGIPLRVQLRERLLTAIGAGMVAPGERLPTMREVAVHLGIDLNTVQRAYAELERIGAIETRRARGSFVADHPPSPDPARQAGRLSEFCAATIAAARAQGLDPARVAAVLEIMLKEER